MKNPFYAGIVESKKLSVWNTKGITQEEYDNIRARFQKDKNMYSKKLDRLNEANEEYYIHATPLLNLASRSYEIFTGSEPDQKRKIIGTTLQNLLMKDGKVQYDWQKPFDKIFQASQRSSWGEKWNVVRTYFTSSFLFDPMKFE